MKLGIQLPRKSEASIKPDNIDNDIIIKPRFYRRKGWVNIVYFTVVDAHNHEDRYVLTVSAGNKQLRLEKLIEVIPDCDKAVTKDKDNADSGSTGNTST